MTFVSLDHNATTDPYPEVIALVAEVMAEAGNPSSVHGRGRAATGRLETARRQVAGLCGARARDLTFFGSATEANNAVINHFRDWTFLRPASEHAAIIDVRPGKDLSLNEEGHVDLDELERFLAQSQGPVLLCIMAANNETGLISNLAEIKSLIAAARARGAVVHYHIDGVQAPGKLAIDVEAWGCDSLALSSHKMGGPQGVGALIVRPGFDLVPQILGGGQERKRRAGTENVAGIAGFGLAAELCKIQDYSELQSILENGLKAINPACQIVGEGAMRLSNTTCVLTPGKSAETMLMQFDLAGLGLSSGSACSSGKVGASHVLTALGFSEDLARSALRFSLGRSTTKENIDLALATYGATCR